VADSLPTEAPSNGVEALVRDGVEEQRAKGLIPTPNRVKDYLLPIVERGDRKTEEVRLRARPNPPGQPVERVERSTPEMEREFKRRLARKGHEPLPGAENGWITTRKPIESTAPSRLAVQSKRDAVARSRFRRRYRLLVSLPDWRAKLMTVNPLAINGTLGPEKQKHAEQVIRQIVSDSDRVFGSWLAEPKRKLHFHR
jgi:hypothetical protein